MRIFGLVLGISFLVWSFSLVNWENFFQAVTSLKPVWVALCAASLLLSMRLRGIRWHILTGLPAKDQPKVWEATCIGYLGAAIYPARVGDVMRILRLQKITNIGAGLAIGSGVIDRIFEGLGLCALLLILLLFWKAGLEAQQALFAVALMFLIAAAGAAFFVLRGNRLQPMFERIARVGKWGIKIKHWYEQSFSGLQALRSPKRIILAVITQLMVSLIDILSCWFLIQSFGWTLPFMAAVMVLVYIAAAASLPSSPGYVGVYQIATVFAFRPYGVDDSASVAYGTVMQVLTLILFIVAGLRFSVRKKDVA